jgi:hypothetical protein
MLDQLDSLTGNCGLLPTLLERIGSMAAHGQHRPGDFTPRGYSAPSACGAPSLPGIPATRSAGPEVPARPPVKTTATSIASRTGQGPGNRDTGGEPRVSEAITEAAHAAKRRVRRGPPAKTTPTSLASGPARAPSHVRGCDNWKRRGSTSRPAGRSMDRRIVVRCPTAAFPGENP